ncbi:MAG: hypothetical protein ACFFCD_00390 [Promethearchaeota archaeon]
MAKITVKEWKEQHGYTSRNYIMDLKNKIALRDNDMIDEDAKEDVDIKVYTLYPGG